MLPTISRLLAGSSNSSRYWEAKLAPGHVPSEGKMENFVRTKYEHKRWVMDGGIPDPSTLDDEDDDNVVRLLLLPHSSLRRILTPRSP